MDGTLFTAINGWAGHSEAMDSFFVMMSRLGPFVMIGLLAALWFWPSARPRRDRMQWGAIVAVFGVVLALAVNQVISRWLWARPRPFVSHPATMLLPPSRDPSFPSDHATFAFAIAFALLLTAWRIGLATFVFAALLALSRIYTGEHYLGDVAASMLVGGTVATALHLGRPYLARLVEPPLRVARRLHLA